MCCDAPSAPQVDPRQYDAVMKQLEIGDKLFAHTVESDKLNRERQARLDEQQAPLIQGLIENQRKQEARADESYQYFMNTGRPAIQRALDDANSFDSAEELANVRNKASSDVEQAFAGRKEATTRGLQRMGIGPLNGRALSAMGDLDAQGALGKVQTVANVTEGRRAGGLQLRQQAANLASGMPAQAIAMSSTGASQGAQGAGLGNAGMGASLAAQGAFNGGMGAAGNAFGSAANGFGNIYSQKLAGAQFDAANSTGTALGQLAGMGANFASSYFMGAGA